MVLTKLCELIFLLSLINHASSQSLRATPNKFPLGNSGTLRKDTGTKNDPTRPWRLPLNIIPSHYDLSLTPILDQDVQFGDRWTAPGSVKITLQALENTTNKIVLHANNLQISESETRLYETGTTTQIQIHNHTYDNDTTFLTILLNEDLKVRVNYTLEFTFLAQIQIELHGLYRSSYVDPTNTTKWLAVTQMEALHAREVFPCFDEPSFKAVFSTSLKRHKDHVALSNSESIRNTTLTEEGYEDWILETFGDTVPMSTYLVAILISEFGYSEALGQVLPEITVRSYAPKHYIERDAGVYPSKVAEQMLKGYETHFGQKYPLSKMDMAAVPDFFFGAMENFGLNIYVDDFLLYFPDETTEAERSLLTEVIAHELAHQYFGNLVSPAWWTHIWLNEGMTKFVEFLGMSYVAQEFNPWDIFITDVLQVALAFDAVKKTSHPIKIGEEEWVTQDAMSWFDTISYHKGGCLARMMEGFLTPTQFQAGLRNYQSKMAFKAAVQDDLFNALSNNSANKLPQGRTLTDVMNTWTLQAGFPFLNVSTVGNNQIQVTQAKFGEITSSAQWDVPISIASKSSPNFDPQPEHWLTSKTMNFNENGNNWLILNAGSTGFYRVLYSAELEDAILEQLESNHKIIHTHSRSQLLDDYFSFVWNKFPGVNIGRALAFTKYMGSQPEEDLTVWTALLTHLEQYLNLFESAGMLDEMKEYLLPRIKSAIEATGGINAINPNSKGANVIRHARLLDWTCALGDEDCIKHASDLVTAWKNDININPVQRDLKPIVYCAAARNMVNFVYLLELYVTNDSTKKQRSILLNSLACVEDSTMTNTLLQNTISKDLQPFLDQADALAFLVKLSSNPKARSQLVSFISTNTTDIIAAFGGSITPICSVVSALSNFMSSETDLAKIQNLISKHETILEGSLDIYVAKIQANIALIKEFGTPMQEYFKTNSQPEDNEKGTASTSKMYFLPLVILYHSILFCVL